MNIKLGKNSPRCRELLSQLMGWQYLNLEQFDDLLDKGVSIEIKPIVGKHTESQRGYYWASMHEYGNWAGYSRREVEGILHNAILCETYGVKGEMVVAGRKYELPKQRSSDAKKDEYSELIGTLIRVAGEAGFVIEDPSEAA